MSVKPLRWGIVSTGNIARRFAEHLRQAEHGTLAAVGSRNAVKAKAFAGEFGGSGVDGYEALVTHPDVDALYVATPHPQHAEWAIKAARAGKHVLVEKPIAVNKGDAEAMFDEARRAGVVMREGFMYRCHPLLQALLDTLPELGTIRLIEATYAFNVGPDHTDPDSRLLDPHAAGGSLLDVGCYATDLARLVAGAEPEKVQGAVSLGETGVDETAAATLQFSDGVIAQVRSAIRLDLPGPQLRIFGDRGQLDAHGIFYPTDDARLVLRVGDEERTITRPCDKPLFALEADAFAAVVAGQGDGPLPTPEGSIGNMATLDRWRPDKYRFPIERPEAYRKTTIGGTPLTLGDVIPRHTLPGVARPVAALVMGSVGIGHLHDAAPLFDAYWQAGGNAFDTGLVYGWRTNYIIGEWIKHRGVGDEVVIACKGAHSPYNLPAAIEVELDKQLDLLQRDFCDVYFLHRDNEQVPVGEFVDVLDDLADRGKIRGLYGGSNWSLDRVKAANAYAKDNGKRGFGAVSQNLSLAVMNDPVWPDCVTAHTDTWRAWLTDTQTPNFAWSSQARGFFVDGRDLDGEEMKRCWVSDDNLERRRRAFELAGKLRVEPINVAGAWVLRQPYPSVALIGPETMAQLQSSVRTVNVTLTDEQAAWLDLRDQP